MSTLVLYQFPVSHFCEKVRWALAYKRLPYKSKNMLPGLHTKKMMKMTGQSSVPVLKDGKNVVAHSSDILSYLDEQFPRFSLTPEDESEHAKAMEIEAWADKDVGPAVRLLCYAILLERPDLLVPMFTYQGPWYGGFVAQRIFPKVRDALIKRLPITEESIAASKKNLHTVVETFTANYADDAFMVGKSLSRADVAMASLWAPLFRMGKYGVEWPDSVPVELQQLEEEFAAMKNWVQWVYTHHR